VFELLFGGLAKTGTVSSLVVIKTFGRTPMSLLAFTTAH
jgi:hypothetical protein